MNSLTRPSPSYEKILTFLNVSFEKAKIKKFELRQIGLSAEHIVETWEDDDVNPQVDREEFAAAIFNKAEEDAAGLSGAPRYVLLSYRENARAYTSRCMFRVSSNNEHNEDKVENDESPTPYGLVQMMMRHM